MHRGIQYCMVQNEKHWNWLYLCVLVHTAGTTKINALNGNEYRFFVWGGKK